MGVALSAEIRSMTKRLEQQTLQQLCARPRTAYHMSEVAAALRGLAPWWLQDEVCELAAREEPWQSQGASWLTARPRLPDTSGSCWVLFASEDRERFPLLHPAFLLPLVWKPDSAHSPHLPQGLQRLAEEVVDELQRRSRHADRRWGLCLADSDGIDRLDLSGLSEDAFSCDSGKASLAAGLICAVEGSRPDPRVWATGTWGAGRDSNDVGGLPAKLELARQWQVREMFVPKPMMEKAKARCAQHGNDLEIGALDLSAETIDEKLAGYLASLDVQPPLGEEGIAEEARNWYLRQWNRRRDRALAFYREQLLPRISRQCRERIRQKCGGQSGKSPSLALTHLVTIASDNPELIPLAAAALEVRHCLILYTADKQDKMEAAKMELERLGRCAKEMPFEANGDLSRQFGEAVSCFTAGTTPEHVAFDLTPGTKLMSLTLAYQVAQQGSWLHYLRHERRGTAVCPGTERPMLWQAGSSWQEGIMT